MKILAIGGTGHVGSAVVTELRARGTDVRVLVRDEKTKLPDGVESARGDLLDPPTIMKALDGCDGVYLLNAVTPDELTQGLVAVDLARRAKVGRLVYHSVFDAQRFPDVPHFAAKVAIETALRASDLRWTIVRPNYFFQNDAGLREPLTQQGVYPIPLGETGISAVDVRDIAEAAAIALTTPGHDGTTYALNGPDLVSGPAAAAIWSEALGRPVTYGGDDFDAFERQTAQQSSPITAFDMRMMFQGYVERGFAAGPDDVATLTKLLGHPPRNYADFVRETAASWSDTK